MFSFAARRLDRFWPSLGGGFSLVELLIALGVVGVLGGLLVSVGASSQSFQVRTRSELSHLSQALEGYRRDFGDYPRTGAFSSVEAGAGTVSIGTAEAKLFNALIGRLGPGLAPVAGRCRVELERLTFLPGAAVPAVPGTDEIANAFIDPWGHPYRYRYRATLVDPWEAPAYLLYSLGPDGEELPPRAGLIEPQDPRNADNVYASR